MSRYRKVKVEQIGTDPRYQRDLDERRAQAMAKNIDMARIGVPALSERPNGNLVVIDGQHRVSALMFADMGKTEIMCEIHEGLNLRQEAALFLKLNGGRNAVAAYHKYRAELTARVPVALEIEGIVVASGLRVARAKGPRHVCAVDAIRGVHLRRKNLPAVLSVLKGWSKDDPGVFDGELIKAVSVFLFTYREVDTKHLSERLSFCAPESVQRRIAMTTSKADGVTRSDAACIVLRELYNQKWSRNKLPPLHVIRDQQAEDAA